MLPAKIELQGERARRSLHEFVKLMWPALEPGAPFRDGIHIALICQALEAVIAGVTKRLIITVPPRHGKSNLVSILWPAWVWITYPETRWLFASYAQSLAERHSAACRRLIESPPYQQMYGSVFQLSADTNQKSHFENTRGGARLATSVGGAATGEGGDVVVVDDAAKIEEGSSRLAREKVIDFFDHTLSTRLNDPGAGAIVIVCQRLHERDLVGHLIDQSGFEHLCLPAEYDPQHPYLNDRDPRCASGELLWPAQFGPVEMAELKRRLGPSGAASQLQQLPAPAGGVIFPRTGWRWYHPNERPAVDQVIISIDLALTTGTHSDYCVAQVWGSRQADKYLLHQERAKLSFLDQLAMVEELSTNVRQNYAAGYAPAVYIEKSATAIPLIEMLESKIPALIPVVPRGDKESRAMAIAPQVHAGNIHLPGAPNARRTNHDRDQTPGFVQQFIDETAAFPHSANDDQVDAFTQAISKLSEQGPRLRVLG